ncbi:esterase/lipase family protein [Streptomyces sp. NPDC002888]|uniref:esterase/lipase family protein n=1 Tax=Streptomyces sp. NPDC002888 TaxID=3364668 RepID=UPI0036B40789
MKNADFLIDESSSGHTWRTTTARRGRGAGTGGLMAKKPLRDMVVLLPGITGSVLRSEGRDIWGPSAGALWSALTAPDEWRDQLSLRDGDPGAVTASRLMPDAHLVPGLVKIDGYSSPAALIRDTFDVVPGSPDQDAPANYIEFPYDWRLDNRVSARRLAQVVDGALRRWRKHSQAPDARVIFLAHSMGGLVARYYLEVLGGWRTCRALITFGTPYRGSLNALDFLANGYKKLFVDLTEVMRSFPSVHQLLPVYRALRVGDEYVRVAETDKVPGVDPVLAADALAFHREIEAKVTEHLDDEDYRTGGYTVLPVVGTHQKTRQSGTLTGARVEVSSRLPDWIDPLLDDGDGTVPRASATPIELSDAHRDTFVAERHGSLQCNPTVLTDLRGRLEQSQVRGLREIRGPRESPRAAKRPALALDIDDLYLAGEPVVLRGRSIGPAPDEPVRAVVQPVVHGRAPAPFTVEPVSSTGGGRLELPQLPPGLYRVEVRTAKAGPDAPLPVHDIFAVAGVER